MRSILLTTSFVFLVLLSFGQCLQIRLDFDNNLFDSSGYAHVSTTGGSISYVTDRHGVANSAVYFNGTSNIRLDDDYDFPNRTVTFWFKPSVIASTVGCMYESDNNTILNGETELLVYDPSYGDVVNTKIGPNTNNINRKVNVGDWHRLTVVRDDMENRYYLDCQLIGIVYDMSNGHSVSAGFLPTSALGSGGNNTVYYTGAMDDFAIYNCALSDEEVKALNDTDCACHSIIVHDTLTVYDTIIQYDTVIQGSGIVPNGGDNCGSSLIGVGSVNGGNGLAILGKIEDKLERVTISSIDGKLMFDNGGNLTYVNEALERIDSGSWARGIYLYQIFYKCGNHVYNLKGKFVSGN